MAMSNILLKEVTMGLFLLISYDGSSLSHYESQSLPSQLEILFKGGAFNGYHKTIRQKILCLNKKIAQTHGLNDFSIRELV
jgi:hypothetical protein